MYESMKDTSSTGKAENMFMAGTTLGVWVPEADNPDLTGAAHCCMSAAGHEVTL